MYFFNVRTSVRNICLHFELLVSVGLYLSGKVMFSFSDSCFFWVSIFLFILYLLKTILIGNTYCMYMLVKGGMSIVKHERTNPELFTDQVELIILNICRLFI